MMKHHKSSPIYPNQKLLSLIINQWFELMPAEQQKFNFYQTIIIPHNLHNLNIMYDILLSYNNVWDAQKQHYTESKYHPNIATDVYYLGKIFKLLPQKQVQTLFTNGLKHVNYKNLAESVTRSDHGIQEPWEEYYNPHYEVILNNDLTHHEFDHNRYEHTLPDSGVDLKNSFEHPHLFCLGLGCIIFGGFIGVGLI